MNRAERIVRLHALLRGKRPVALRAMTGALEASRATVVRDLAYLRDFLGAPILYDRAANGHRYDPQAGEFELPGFWLNASELHALLASARLLEEVQPGILTPHLTPLTARIRKILGEAGHPSEAVAARIRVLSAARRRVAPERFGEAAQAVLEARTLAIAYEGRARAERTERTVHPHRLVHYKDNWYLLAWCEAAGDLRTFSLDRVRSAKVQHEPVRPIPDEELDAYLEDSFGIFAGPPKGKALLRFTPEAARWVADETWHPEQKSRWQGGSYELELPYADLRELTREVLRFGPKVEVLEPEELRASIAELHERAAARYRKK